MVVRRRLDQLDGFEVEVLGRPRTLASAGLRVVPVPINLLETILNLLTNPNVVFLLLALGAQAILIELSSPGGWVAGFIGVVALALAFYGLGVLPVNWFGALFILISFVLFILDVKAPTHGALTAAGIGSLIHIYSTGYMHGDPGFYRFFAYMGLFMFSMLVLVMGSNFVMMSGSMYSDQMKRLSLHGSAGAAAWALSASVNSGRE